MIVETIQTNIASVISHQNVFKPASRLDGIGEYYFSQKLREIDQLNKQGKNIINLGIGSPDLPPHPDVIKTLQQESIKPHVHGYQNYKGSPVLRNAISTWYKNFYSVDLDPDTEVLPLIGSKEGIMHICMTYFQQGDTVLVPNPGYPTYSSAVKLSGAMPVYFDLLEKNNYQPDLAQLKELSNAKAIFLNYPHMPVGASMDMQTMKAVIDWATQNNILIIHDNPYSFILNETPQSLLSIDGAKNVVIELNSLSKSHNMAGWRIGMLCAAKEKVNEVLRFKSNMDSGMFLPVQLAAAKALTLGKEWHDEVNAIYSERREKVYAMLDILGCSYSKKQAGLFIWASVPAMYEDGYALCDKILYHKNVFITPGGIFGTAGNHYIRISLCGSIEKFDEAILRIKASPNSFGSEA